MKTLTKSQSKGSPKVLAATLVVLTALAAVGLILGSTLAAPGDVRVAVTPPAGVTASNTIEVGATKGLTVGNLNQAYSSDTSTATVAYTQGSVPNNIATTGVKAGMMNVVYGTKAGVASYARYFITDSRNISEYTLSQGGKVSIPTVGSSVPGPVKDVVGTDPAIRWVSLDETVATVDGSTGAITAVTKGAAIIIGRYTDKWGREQDIHVLVEVGVRLGDSDLWELINLINQGKDKLGKEPNQYTDESLETLDDAVKKGESVVDNEGRTEQEIKDAIDDLKNALSNLEEKTNGGYVEGPENIWTPIDENGDPDEDNKFWGGPDGKPGGGDDLDVLEADGSYWVHVGQNVWREYDSDNPQGPLGPLTGGGPDGNPATDPVTEIFDNTDVDGKYYVGPLGPDGDGNIYYYGDPAEGNGTLDSTAAGTEKDDVKYYRNEDGTMTTTKPAKPITEKPDIADENGNGGRVLTPSQTGDSANWIEIARNGDYSLIVRADYINVNENHYGEVTWQGLLFGLGGSSAYQGSNLQTAINHWFNGTSEVENLPGGAKLRSFTVSNNASYVPGGAPGYPASLTDGFSKPTSYRVGTGNDVAFALSFSEAANFVSKEYTTVPGGTVYAESGPIAAKNFGKLAPYSFPNEIWLRSPGASAGSAAAMGHTFGRIHQNNTGSATNLVYPALWVHNSIFE
ncbi:MAG: FIVAR domain-containing protein [Clostridiales bacterium]|nr:FIVAR domain-containing protein [Clostridiales bacterium]